MTSIGVRERAARYFVESTILDLITGYDPRLESREYPGPCYAVAMAIATRRATRMRSNTTNISKSMRWY